MAGAGALYDTNRRGMLAQLRAVARAYGHPAAGVVAESLMAAVAEFVREGQGDEAAFEVLTRHAEAVIAPRLADWQQHQQQQRQGDR